MFSEDLLQIIARDRYMAEWRFRTAVCLFAIGMSELGIRAAITGNLDKKHDCKTLCSNENIEFVIVWNIIKN